MPASAAALTVYLFGVTALAAGLHGLLDPPALAARLGLALPSCVPSLRGNALAALAMGLYYALAAYQENRAFFVLSVPMRLLSAAVFAKQGWTAAAVLAALVVWPAPVGAAAALAVCDAAADDLASGVAASDFAWPPAVPPAPAPVTPAPVTPVPPGVAEMT